MISQASIDVEPDSEKNVVPMHNAVELRFDRLRLCVVPVGPDIYKVIITLFISTLIYHADNPDLGEVQSVQSRGCITWHSVVCPIEICSFLVRSWLFASRR